MHKINGKDMSNLNQLVLDKTKAALAKAEIGAGKLSASALRALAFAYVSALREEDPVGFGDAAPEEYVGEFFRQPRGSWTEERIRALAASCATGAEFKKADRLAYAAAIRYGLLGDLFPTTRNPNGYWTEARVRGAASSFITASAFRKGNQAAHGTAKRMGILREIFPATKRSQGYWGKETVRVHAARFDALRDVKKYDYGAYRAAQRLGILRDLFPAKEEPK